MSGVPTYSLFTTGDPNGSADFYVGRVPDGRGLMAGETTFGLLVIWFGATGRLLEHQMVPLQHEPPRRNTRQVLDWLAQQSFRSERIEVEDFAIDDPVFVGISPYPHWAEPLSPDADLSDPDIQRRQEYIRQWDEDGRFVVHWGGGNFYLNKHGGYSS